jgi:hypothetical protein
MEFKVLKGIRDLKDHRDQQVLLVLRDHKVLYKVLRVVKVLLVQGQ